MSGFGNAAVRAARTCQRQPRTGPLEAWQQAVKVVFPDNASMRAKSCPKSTFLGLCEEGLVSGIPSGKYTRSQMNKAYALRAVGFLQANPSLASDPLALWGKVMAEEAKVPNGQMEVVVALWRAGFLVQR